MPDFQNSPCITAATLAPGLIIHEGYRYTLDAPVFFQSLGVAASMVPLVCRDVPGALKAIAATWYPVVGAPGEDGNPPLHEDPATVAASQEELRRDAAQVSPDNEVASGGVPGVTGWRIHQIRQTRFVLIHEVNGQPTMTETVNTDDLQTALETCDEFDKLQVTYGERDDDELPAYTPDRRPDALPLDSEYTPGPYSIPVDPSQVGSEGVEG